MYKVFIILITLFFNNLSLAESISSSCELIVKNKMLQQAGKFLELSVSSNDFDYEIQLSENKIYTSLTGKVDGSYFYFESPIDKLTLKSCSIEPKINLAESCRYSNYGGKEIADINGIILGQALSIENDKKLSFIQKQQLKELLIYGEKNSTLNELIKNTDQKAVLYSLVMLPNGKILDYYTTYDGGNNYGVFYIHGTLSYAGLNSDDSICITFFDK